MKEIIQEEWPDLFVSVSSEVQPIIQEYNRTSCVAFDATSTDALSVGNMCDFPADDSIVALTDHIVRKVPYPTTTKRIQFYLDHPVYLYRNNILVAYL